MSVIQLDWTLLVSAGIFLLTLVLLNRLLFQPLFRVLEERRSQTTDLRVQADNLLRRQQTLLNQYEEKVREERQAGYRAAEATRNQALEERQQKISETRRRAGQLVEESRQQIEEELEQARRQLSSEADQIAQIIAARVLSR